MEENRWTRKVFIWDKETTGLWSRDVHALFCKYGFDELFLKNKNSVYVCLENLCLLKECSKEQWESDIWPKPKTANI